MAVSPMQDLPISPPPHMDTPTLTPADWKAWLVQPAIVLGGMGLFVRLVLWPAVKNMMREEFKKELDAAEGDRSRLTTIENRVNAHAEALQRLADVPVMLARIEENLAQLMERRSRVRND